ncbi:hypothetical protein KFK09_012714 [Dendrobium nobile]|uniref:Uncharacterized protein n=1 Tax=Dendrobium nobile TaxID=94219 RepID=A0A8T3BG26_DENNO|nr:hypothetical protein KFK09_012714 [Dendrobium nobile]
MLKESKGKRKPLPGVSFFIWASFWSIHYKEPEGLKMIQRRIKEVRKKTEEIRMPYFKICVVPGKPLLILSSSLHRQTYGRVIVPFSALSYRQTYGRVGTSLFRGLWPSEGVLFLHRWTYSQTYGRVGTLLFRGLWPSRGASSPLHRQTYGRTYGRVGTSLFWGLWPSEGAPVPFRFILPTDLWSGRDFAVLWPVAGRRCSFPLHRQTYGRVIVSFHFILPIDLWSGRDFTVSWPVAGRSCYSRPKEEGFDLSPLMKGKVDTLIGGLQLVSVWRDGRPGGMSTPTFYFGSALDPDSLSRFWQGKRRNSLPSLGLFSVRTSRRGQTLPSSGPSPLFVKDPTPASPSDAVQPKAEASPTPSSPGRRPSSTCKHVSSFPTSSSFILLLLLLSFLLFLFSYFFFMM